MEQKINAGSPSVSNYAPIPPVSASAGTPTYSPHKENHVNPKDLLSYRQAELAELFATLPAPASNQAEGYWRGTLMAFSGLGWLPRWLGAGLYSLMASPINPWRGKSFHNGEGANRLFGIPGVGFAFYTMSAIDSPLDNKPALRLNYDRPDNLAPLRRIRGEGRVLSDGVMLCRMLWQTQSRLHTVLYFTLVRAAD